MSDLANAIAAIGDDAFPEKLLALFHGVSGADLCSAFEIGEDGELHFLFAAGHHPNIPSFAETASLAYARTFWRKDQTTRRALSAATGGVQLVRQAWNGIADSDYRRTCYERGEIVERLTLYAAGGRAIFASAYRTRQSGPSTAAEIEALEKAAPDILALIVKHVDVTSRAQFGHAPLHEMSRILSERGKLSAREAAVAAALLIGKSQAEIASETGVALSSVITYRRRAYRKLGVATRRDLQALIRTRPALSPT